MAKTYKITRAKNAGEKPNPHGGTLIKWYMDLETANNSGPVQQTYEDVYTQKKPGNDLNVGDEIYGRIEKGDYGLRFFAEKREDAPTGQSGGTDWDARDADIRWGLALKLASYRLANGGLYMVNEESEYPAKLQALATELLPIVEAGPITVQEKVESVAQTLSAGPQKPVGDGIADDTAAIRAHGVGPASAARVKAPTKEQLKQAFKGYIDQAGSEVDRELAKNRVNLKLASLGVSDYEKMTDTQAEEVFAFLKSDKLEEEGPPF